MSLAQYNQRYEKIVHSSVSGDHKDYQLAGLMSEMESEFKIPAMRNKAWEKENRAVIAMYRKISQSRNL